MVIFNFKPTSPLNTPIARVLNAIIIIPFALLFSVTSFTLKIDASILLPVAYVLFSVGGGINVILNRNNWIEFDQAEVKRKESFILSYCGLAFIFSFAISVLALKAIECYNNGEPIFLHVIIILYLAFNQINICSLFNFGEYFENRLSAYDCDKNSLLKIEKNIIKDILKKDHHIDLDELLDEVEGWRDAYNEEIKRLKREH